MNEKDILLQTQCKNNDAVEKLLEKYKPLIYATARNFFLANSGDTDDLIQEGTMGFLKAVQTYDESKGVPFSAYATVCVKRKVIGYLRKTVTAAKDFDEEREIFNGAPDIWDNVIEREESSLLQKLMQIKLSAKQYSALRLYLDGYTYKETADYLHVTVKQVDNLLMTAKKKLLGWT